MKRFIVCFVLMVSIMLGLCACQETIIDEGVKRTVHDGTFVEIKTNINDCNFIVYDINTKVVYYLETAAATDGGHLSPYLIYQDGYIYGAIFQDGEIVPVPLCVRSSRLRGTFLILYKKYYIIYI